MDGVNFPISEYYRAHILEAETVSRSGGWWTAVLSIEDPKTKKKFVALYRWQHTESGWKVRKRFTFRRKEEMNRIIEVIQRLGSKLDSGQSDEGDDD